jgi:hypothetical protein
MNVIQEHTSFLNYYSIQCPNVHCRELRNQFDGKYMTSRACLCTVTQDDSDTPGSTGTLSGSLKKGAV